MTASSARVPKQKTLNLRIFDMKRFLALTTAILSLGFACAMHGSVTLVLTIDSDAITGTTTGTFSLSGSLTLNDSGTYSSSYLLSQVDYYALGFDADSFTVDFDGILSSGTIQLDGEDYSVTGLYFQAIHEEHYTNSSFLIGLISASNTTSLTGETANIDCTGTFSVSSFSGTMTLSDIAQTFALYCDADNTITINVVPEPAEGASLAGLAAIGLVLLRRRRAA